MKRPKFRSEERPVSAAISSALSPFVRQFRKFTAMQKMLDVLPEEIRGMAVPFDLRLHRNDAGAELHTMFMYASSATVATILVRRSRRLVADVNALLPVEVLEELHVEVVNPARIEQQLNILSVTPD